MRDARVFAACLVSALAACDGAPPPSAPAAPPDTAIAPLEAPAPKTAGVVKSGGALVQAAHGGLLYLADEDHHVVHCIPLPVDVNHPPVDVAMPGAPAEVVSLSDRVLITIRDPGLVLVMTPDAAAGLVEIGRVKVAADAWGMAVTADEKTALVSSAWTHRVTAVDLEKLEERWSADVAREPRAIVIRPDGDSAYVTHLVGTDLTRIDRLSGEPVVKRVPFAPAPLRTPINAKAKASELGASLAYSAVLSPDGSRMFVPRHALGALGKEAWFGEPTVDVLLLSNESVLAPERTQRTVSWGGNRSEIGEDITVNADGPVPIQFSTPFVQPRAVAYRKSTKTLLVASEGTDALVELDALASDPSIKPLRTYSLRSPDKKKRGALVCGAPSGVALSDDESTAWVHCRSTGDLAVVRLDTFADGEDFELSPIPTVHYADDALDEEAAHGRRLFYDATDRVMSGGLACAGCHPEGRDDGHVYAQHQRKELVGDMLIGAPVRLDIMGSRAVESGFARQTPMLAGRVNAKGPYGWHAKSKVLEQRIEEGFGLHRWDGFDDPSITGNEGAPRAAALAAFLRKGLVPPPRESRPLTVQEEWGKNLFMSSAVGCTACHDPETDYTNRAKVDLPFGRSPRPGFEREVEDTAFKTPSLLYVSGTPPYYHDGHAETLEDLIENNADKMGHTSQLGKEDKEALVAFLKTL